MIKVYLNGKDFINENNEFLSKDKYLSVFFYLDAKGLDKTDKGNFAIKVSNDNKELLAIKLSPYPLCLYGDNSLVNELITYLNQNGYIYNETLCPEVIGDKLEDVNFYKFIGMDFMEANEYTLESSNEVTKPNESDIDELFILLNEFFKECGLPDKADNEKIKKILSNIRIIREDGKIISLAAFTKNTDDSCRITHVYTRKEYRDKHYAKKVVNYIKNEILDLGFIATLNVDQKNPISNHLYKSLGFKKVYAQGMYKKK